MFYMRFFLCLLMLISVGQLVAQDVPMDSPDKKVLLTFVLEDGKPYYSLQYNQKLILDKSPLYR